MFTMNTESNMMARISAIAFALFCGAFLAAEAGEIHVDAAASPDGADGTQERPYATIQDAVDNAKEGDTIKVAAGIYDRGMRQVSGISYARVSISGKKKLKIVGAGRGRSFIVG
jgi:pectin methylesterase-like acyl-CoA thioesterase